MPLPPTPTQLQSVARLACSQARGYSSLLQHRRGDNCGVAICNSGVLTSENATRVPLAQKRHFSKKDPSNANKRKPCASGSSTSDILQATGAEASGAGKKYASLTKEPLKVKELKSLGTTFKVGYLDLGRPTGDTILIIHSSPGTCENFEALYGPMVSSGCRLIVPNMPGYGITKAKAGFPKSHENNKQFIIDFLRALEIPKLSCVIGQSFGNYTALSLAATTDLTKGLVAISCPGVKLPSAARLYGVILSNSGTSRLMDPALNINVLKIGDIEPLVTTMSYMMTLDPQLRELASRIKAKNMRSLFVSAQNNKVLNVDTAIEVACLMGVKKENILHYDKNDKLVKGQDNPSAKARFLALPSNDLHPFKQHPVLVTNQIISYVIKQSKQDAPIEVATTATRDRSPIIEPSRETRKSATYAYAAAEPAKRFSERKSSASANSKPRTSSPAKTSPERKSSASIRPKSRTSSPAKPNSERKSSASAKSKSRTSSPTKTSSERKSSVSARSKSKTSLERKPSTAAKSKTRTSSPTKTSPERKSSVSAKSKSRTSSPAKTSPERKSSASARSKPRTSSPAKTSPERKTKSSERSPTSQSSRESRRSAKYPYATTDPAKTSPERNSSASIKSSSRQSSPAKTSPERKPSVFAQSKSRTSSPAKSSSERKSSASAKSKSITSSTAKSEKRSKSRPSSKERSTNKKASKSTSKQGIRTQSPASSGATKQPSGQDGQHESRKATTPVKVKSSKNLAITTLKSKKAKKPKSSAGKKKVKNYISEDAIEVRTVPVPSCATENSHFTGIVPQKRSPKAPSGQPSIK